MFCTVAYLITKHCFILYATASSLIFSILNPSPSFILPTNRNHKSRNCPRYRRRLTLHTHRPPILHISHTHLVMHLIRLGEVTNGNGFKRTLMELHLKYLSSRAMASYIKFIKDLGLHSPTISPYSSPQLDESLSTTTFIKYLY